MRLQPDICASLPGRGPGAPRRVLPVQRLSGPHPAGGGSGPSLPLHLQSQPVARGGPPRRGRRGAVRPGEGPQDPAALGAAHHAESVRTAGGGHRRQPGVALSRGGDPGVVHLPDHPEHRSPDRQRRRGGRSAQPHPGGGPQPALRRGGADRGARLDAGLAAAAAAGGIQRAAGAAGPAAHGRRSLRGARACWTRPTCWPSRRWTFPSSAIPPFHPGTQPRLAADRATSST